MHTYNQLYGHFPEARSPRVQSRSLNISTARDLPHKTNSESSKLQSSDPFAPGQVSV